MGQAAEDACDGTTCMYCGMFFEDGKTHGYPVVCQDEWDEMTTKERRAAKQAGLQRALHETM